MEKLKSLHRLGSESIDIWTVISNAVDPKVTYHIRDQASVKVFHQTKDTSNSFRGVELLLENFTFNQHGKA
jgi:hypothetical protein